MLAPPFLDHRTTSELDLIRTNCRTHARHGVKHCSSGNGLRQMIQGWGFLATGCRALYGGRGLLPQDTQCLTHHELHHTLFVSLFSKHDRH
jgi:hypothetical protein